jgi:hypothetical protein
VSLHESAGGVRGADGGVEAAVTQDGRRWRRPHRAARRHQVSGPAACVRRRLTSLSATPHAMCRHAPAGTLVSVSSPAEWSFRLGTRTGCGTPVSPVECVPVTQRGRHRADAALLRRERPEEAGPGGLQRLFGGPARRDRPPGISALRPAGHGALPPARKASTRPYCTSSTLPPLQSLSGNAISLTIMWPLDYRGI